MTTENLPEGCVYAFTDHAGNRHHMRTGKVAAEMIASGDTPELLVDDCKELQRHLDEMGFFPRRDPRVPSKGFQYVVYHGKPADQGDDEISNYRVISNWNANSITAWTKDLPGWGLEPQSPILNVPASKFDPFTRIFRVFTITPLLFPYSEEQERKKGSAVDMDPASLAKLFLLWKDEHTLPEGILEVDCATIKADPVYLGMGCLKMPMKVKAFDRQHAEFMAGPGARPFLDEVIAQMGCTPRPKLRSFILAESELVDLPEPAASVDSDRSRT